MKTTLVVTSIHPPTRAVDSLASGCLSHGWDFLLAGDSKGPAPFELPGCRFLALDAQRDSGFKLADHCLERSYTRKNMAYLEAIRGGAEIVVETDDDNHPLDSFWEPRSLEKQALEISHEGWVNVYSYFTSEFIYPRGMPLRHARNPVPQPSPAKPFQAPIQQGLADSDPDVDAIYRMMFPLPFSFDKEKESVFLQPGAWCPFNSQNTTFFRSAFPLLYLPGHCSFRMTDIWRSFIAQRILHARGYGVLFHSQTVWQERNEHDLDSDFCQELPGYTHNAAIREELTALSLPADLSTATMLEKCYECMIAKGWIGPDEEKLVELWLADLSDLGIN